VLIHYLLNSIPGSITTLGHLGERRVFWGGLNFISVACMKTTVMHTHFQGVKTPCAPLSTPLHNMRRNHAYCNNVPWYWYQAWSKRVKNNVKARKKLTYVNNIMHKTLHYVSVMWRVTVWRKSQSKKMGGEPKTIGVTNFQHSYYATKRLQPEWQTQHYVRTASWEPYP